MSHLQTATFTNDDGTAINVPTSGVTGPEAIDPREALRILLSRGWTPIPFPSEKEAIDAAKKTSEAWGALGHSRNDVQSRLEQLAAMAQQRPDLTKIQKPYTFAGRVVSGLDKETPQSIMSRTPIGELEGGGQAMGAIPQGLLVAGMAKQFRPAAALSNEEIAARLRSQFESGEIGAGRVSRTVGGKVFRDAPTPIVAPAGAKSLSHIEEMYPALVNVKSGEIYYNPTRYQPGLHTELWKGVPPADQFNVVRGFVDPKTGHTFTEAQMEEQLMNKWFSIRPHP